MIRSCLTLSLAGLLAACSGFEVVVRDTGTSPFPGWSPATTTQVYVGTSNVDATLYRLPDGSVYIDAPPQAEDPGVVPTPGPIVGVLRVKLPFGGEEKK